MEAHNTEILGHRKHFSTLFRVGGASTGSAFRDSKINNSFPLVSLVNVPFLLDQEVDSVDMFLADIMLQHLGQNCNATNDFGPCIKDTVRQTLAIEVAECPCFLHNTLSSLTQIS